MNTRQTAILLLCLTQPALSQTSAIQLRHGTYVQSEVPCKDAPFAVMRSWDGRGIGSPHFSHCTITISSRNQNTFVVTNICTAQGDGTPTTPYPEHFRLTVIHNVAFSLTNRDASGHQQIVHYRYCPDDSH